MKLHRRNNNKKNSKAFISIRKHVRIIRIRDRHTHVFRPWMYMYPHTRLIQAHIHTRACAADNDDIVDDENVNWILNVFFFCALCWR